jgi:hypothetical protein
MSSEVQGTFGMTDIVNSNPAQARCTRYTIVIKFVSDLRQVRFFPGTLVTSTSKTDRNNIAEILLKVELNTIGITPHQKMRVPP